MNKRIVIFYFSTILVAALLFSCGGQKTRHDEPVYQGVRLSEWLNKLDAATQMGRQEQEVHTGDERTKAQVHEIEKAIRVIGADAIPTLLEALMHEDQEWKAIFAFEILKSIARPALPELTKMLNDPNPHVREAAARAFGAIGPTASDAVPFLLEHIYDPAVNVQISVRHALGDVHERSDIVVPRLIHSLEKLQQTNNSYMASIIALGNFGLDAKPAIPALSVFLDDTNSAVRAFAATALTAITSNAVKRTSL